MGYLRIVHLGELRIVMVSAAAHSGQVIECMHGSSDSILHEASYSPSRA